MQRILQRTLVGILLVIAGGIVVHAPLTVWLGTIWPHESEILKAWKELLMGVALIILIVIAIQRKMIDALLQDRLMQLALVFAGLHLITMAVVTTNLHAEAAGLLIDLRFVFYFVLVYGTLKLFPQYRTLFVKVFGGGAVVVIGFALLQLFVLPKDILAHIGYSKQTIAPYLTVDQNQSYIRFNSTLRGPNPLGAYAMIVLSFLVVYALKFWRKLQISHRVLLAVGAVASALVVGTSYSRSSVVGLVVALVAVAFAVLKPRARAWFVGAVAAVVIVAGISLFALRHNTVVSNVVLHDNPTGGSAQQSNAGHEQSLVDGVKLVLSEPLGGGIGSTGSASLDTKSSLVIENGYLFIAHEIGWLGLIVFLWLFGEIMVRLWQRRDSTLALGTFASGIGMAVIGLFLPVWTDDTTSIVWWGLAAVAVSTTLKRKNHGTRKSH